MTDRPRYSIVVPAHNEEELLPRGLRAIRTAIDQVGASAEIVVVANRCTDLTVEIAEAAGAVVVLDEHRNLAATRNAGVAASTGDIVVTIDADTVMHPGTLAEIDGLIATGQYVGGGSSAKTERMSIGLAITLVVGFAMMAATRSGAIVFWCRRDDFDAIGGFDEELRIAEDLDFAKRLRLHGKATDRRFRNLRRSPSTVCVRKWDRYGDWHCFAAIAGAAKRSRTPTEADVRLVDEYFYDFNA
jgi:glycosyltransferase involved in cell wall biosynthesis